MQAPGSRHSRRSEAMGFILLYSCLMDQKLSRGLLTPFEFGMQAPVSKYLRHFKDEGVTSLQLGFGSTIVSGSRGNNDTPQVQDSSSNTSKTRIIHTRSIISDSVRDVALISRDRDGWFTESHIQPLVVVWVEFHWKLRYASSILIKYTQPQISPPKQILYKPHNIKISTILKPQDVNNTNLES